MKIDEYLNWFKADSAAVSSAMPPGSILCRNAGEILEMVLSYASDALVFNEQGDFVNAFAAASYGYGWMDAGLDLGFIAGREPAPIPTLENTIPENLREHLEEKTARYQRMLTEALAGIKIAPDEGSVMYLAADNICRLADRHLQAGSLLIDSDKVNALSLISYGYGWLDCGVRSGLFQITGNRHLFTI
ncbi:MAG TPA: DUF357 domain-containing protein [Methanocorpusculum sp.]|nr:DUF357 domain-containing protein [Methanocorpusculum sp.]